MIRHYHHLQSLFELKRQNAEDSSPRIFYLFRGSSKAFFNRGSEWRAVIFGLTHLKSFSPSLETASELLLIDMLFLVLSFTKMVKYLYIVNDFVKI